MSSSTRKAGAGPWAQKGGSRSSQRASMSEPSKAIDQARPSWLAGDRSKVPGATVTGPTKA